MKTKVYNLRTIKDELLKFTIIIWLSKLFLTIFGLIEIEDE